MGLALLIVLSLVTLAICYFFGQNWLPLLASAQGADIDHQLKLNLVVLGILFFGTQLGLGLFVWRFRERGAKPNSVSTAEASARTELMWLLVAASLFLGTNFIASALWAEGRIQGASSEKNSVQVEVDAVQFRWYFRYPGPDGKFGRTRPELQDASEGNPLGIDRADPDSKDDIVSSTLILPANRNVDLTLKAQDVIHSFFVPAFRVKQDAVPGQIIKIHFTPTRAGEFDIACAELCGLGHYKMNAKLKVLSEVDFQRSLIRPE
jgi:cytochrome c oxidase subunit 2